ncbi:LysR family transcriptional regulator [Thioclava sp. FR2]|uniref:LysR family transcriptional regulator n=1 Tax=Thioclava sp. FR2 TaxID=3445780 RepID=UPI003EBA7EA8
MNFSLRHLRVIREIGATGSASRAAVQTHLTQPAVTQALAKLERELETTLFERRPQGLFPTDEGRMLIERIDRAFQLLDPALAELAPRLVLTVTVSQLQALIAVVETESFSEAARRLGLSQPTVHRAIGQMEQEFGRRMFERTARGVIASKPVQRLARIARLSFAELDQAWADLAETKGREVGRIVIGGLPLSRSCLLGPAIARFRTLRPLIRIKIVDGTFTDLALGLRRGEIDFIIGALRPAETVPDLDQEVLLNDQMTVVCRPDHPLTSRASISLREMSSLPWVVAPDGAPGRATFETLFENGSRPESLVETGSLILMRELLRQSDHLGFASALQVAPELASASLALLPLHLNDAPRPIGILMRQGWVPTRVQSEMLAAVREVAANT